MTKIKICGLSRAEDIAAVNRFLPDYIGFVFAESKRQVNIETAALLKEKLNPRIKAVGVFVNAPIEKIEEIYKKGIIDLIQLHGDEDDAYIRSLKNICGCPVIKAASVGESLPPMPPFADYPLFDTLSAQRGGTGKTFDWNILKSFNASPYFLAGGLTGENISSALALLAPYCVDVSGGVETDGLKDANKIEHFIQTVRQTD